MEIGNCPPQLLLITTNLVNLLQLVKEDIKFRSSSISFPRGLKAIFNRDKFWIFPNINGTPRENPFPWIRRLSRFESSDNNIKMDPLN